MDLIVTPPPPHLEGSEVFRVKKSNHSKKIVKQLKREYKEDLEKCVKQESKSGVCILTVPLDPWRDGMSLPGHL